MIGSKNIWTRIEPTVGNKSYSFQPRSFVKIKICELGENLIAQNEKYQTGIIPDQWQNYSSIESQKAQRKKGRKKLKAITPYDFPIHSRDNNDNIKRKVKTHFHNFIIAFLNMKIRNVWKGKQQYKFRKMSAKITQDITISYNKKLLDTPIKEILCQVSNKFKDKDSNFNFIEKFIKNKNEIEEILNIKYKDMLEKYYLKSTKELFANEKHDESYERHIELLTHKYGWNYALKFKQNAESFINFYLTAKQRVRKASVPNSPKSDLNEEEIYENFENCNNYISLNEYEDKSKLNSISIFKKISNDANNYITPYKEKELNNKKIFTFPHKKKEINVLFSTEKELAPTQPSTALKEKIFEITQEGNKNNNSANYEKLEEESNTFKKINFLNKKKQRPFLIHNSNDKENFNSLNLNQVFSKHNVLFKTNEVKN